jgi:hypothetical protein
MNSSQQKAIEQEYSLLDDAFLQENSRRMLELNPINPRTQIAHGNGIRTVFQLNGLRFLSKHGPKSSLYWLTSFVCDKEEIVTGIRRNTNLIH